MSTNHLHSVVEKEKAIATALDRISISTESAASIDMILKVNY